MFYTRTNRFSYYSAVQSQFNTRINSFIYYNAVQSQLYTRTNSFNYYIALQSQLKARTNSFTYHIVVSWKDAPIVLLIKVQYKVIDWNMHQQFYLLRCSANSVLHIHQYFYLS